MNKVDLVGSRFGKLVVEEKTKKRTKSGNVYWKCRCDCGNETFVATNNLKTGNTNSCGCIYRLRKYEIENTNIIIIKRKIFKNNTSGCTGVHYLKNRDKWKSCIYLNGKLHFLGLYDELEDAIKARKEAEEKYFQPIIEKFEKLKGDE